LPSALLYRTCYQKACKITAQLVATSKASFQNCCETFPNQENWQMDANLITCAFQYKRWHLLINILVNLKLVN